MARKPRSIACIDEKFTPAEAEKITGVSVELQRVWRRRGIERAKADGKHTRWELADLCRLLVRKQLSDAVHSAGQLNDAVSLADVAVIDWVRFLAHEGKPYAERFRVQTTSPGHTIGRYVVCVGDQAFRTSKLDTFADLSKDYWVDHGVSSPPTVLLVFDCCAAAKIIIERSPRPVSRIEIEYSED